MELIIRRARRNKDSVHPQKTYCLVFAELLTYDVACKSEELITKFLTGNQSLCQEFYPSCNLFIRFVIILYEKILSKV